MILSIIKKLFYICFTLMLILFLIPKVNLYYKLEQVLQENKIIINNEDIKENAFNLDINNGEVYYDDINIAKFSNIHNSIFGFYNHVDISDISISQDMKDMFPYKIDKINTTYSILKPNKIIITSNGDFGNLKGTINLLTNKIYLSIKPSNNIKQSQILDMMRFEKGEYIYEYKF